MGTHAGPRERVARIVFAGSTLLFALCVSLLFALSVSMFSSTSAQAQTNNAATGAPTISGYARTDLTLTADTSGISDDDGLNDVSYSYQWIRVGALNNEMDISGATSDSYSPTTADDLGYRIKVRVEFTDDLGNAESLTSGATLVVVNRNSSATGGPVLSGAERVGETLTVSTDGISDPNGLSNPRFEYTWRREDGGDRETIVASSTQTSHTLVAEDEGKVISVTVVFFDDYNYDHSMTVRSGVIAPLDNTAPTLDTATVNRATLTLTFNEALDTGSVPAAGDFAVTVAGSAVTVSSVAVNGMAVTLTLASAVESGQTVSLNYTPGANPLRDAAENSVAAISGQAVANNTPGAPNTAATGAPTISGFPRTLATLTAGTSGIMDANGLASVSYSYQWIRVDSGDNESDISGATSTSQDYDPVRADIGNRIKVRVSFQDDDGYDESLTSAATRLIKAFDDNTRPTGDLTLSGAERVGETLTVSAAGISDADGLDNARYVYTWSRIDGGDTETIVASSTQTSHTLVAEDEGHTIQVLLDLYDDYDFHQARDVRSGVIAALDDTAPALDTATVNGATLRLTYNEDLDTSSAPTFGDFTVTAAGSEISVAGISVGTRTVVLTLAAAVAAGDAVSLDYTPGTNPIRDLAENDAAALSGETVTNETPAPSDDATLSALALMAGSDAVALTPAFAAGTTAYRAWVANSVSAVTVDATANDSNATVGVTGHSSLSAGRNAIEVQVTAEDGSTTETYTVTLVRAASSPTADPDALLTTNVTAGEVNPGTPGSLLGYSFLDGRNRLGAMSDTNFRVGSSSLQVNAVVAVGGSDVSAFEANTLTLCTQPTISESDLATLSAEVGGVSYGFASAMTFRASVGTCYFWPRGGLSMAWGDVVLVKLIQGAAVNNPATGAPAIGGTETVGETLTASTAGIMDDDGLTMATYSYQWIRVDSSDTETDITGATSATYELVDADEDATIKVRVSFTDDAGNDETLTSDATGEIAAANNPATGAPAISGTETVGETLTADTSAIMDDDGLTGATYTYQWIRVDTSDTETDITGATSATYDLVDADEGATIRVRVSFTDDAGNDETLTSDATGEIAAVADTTAPVFLSASVDGDSLVMNYNEALDTGSTPALANFSVNVAGSGVSLSSVAVSGMTVTVTLASEVDAGATVTLDYTPGTNPIRDLAENPAAALSGETVTNNTPGVLVNPTELNVPEGESATWSLVLTTPPTTEVRITAIKSTVGDPDPDINTDGTQRKIFDDGNWNVPQLVTVIADEDADTVNGSARFTHALATVGRGNYSGLIPDEVTVTEIDNDTAPPNTPATGAPAISGTETVGETLTASTAGIMDDDGLTTASYTYQWIRVDDSDNETDISGATSATYELVDADEGATIKVRVSFTDDAGNDETLTSHATGEIAAVADTTAPVFLSASVDGDSLVMNYNEALDTGSTPALANFSVNVAGSAVSLSSVAVSGMTVTVTLASEVDGGATVTLDYTPGTNPIRDVAENPAAALSGETVTNNTPGVLVNPTELNVPEGESATWSLVLTAPPTTEVRIRAIKSLQGDPDPDINTDGTQRKIFDDGNWNVPQLVTVIADEDADTVNGSAIFNNALATDGTGNYTGLILDDVTVTEIDNDTALSNDATLSALTLEAGGNTISLSPAFASDTTAYRAWVANSVSAVTVDATANDSNATVAVTGHSSLSAGRNAIEVVVTAEDGATTETYTVTLVREASSPTADPDALLTANITVAEEGGAIGLSRLDVPGFGAATALSYQVGGTTYWMHALAVQGATGASPFDAERVTYCFSATVPAAAVRDRLLLNIDGQEFPFEGLSPLGSANPRNRCFNWPRGSVSWAWGDVVPVKIFLVNAAATGAPEISGTETVGETLTASTAGIMDDDGLTGVSYTYQWIRVDSSDDEEDISGATSATYDLVAADEDATIKVRVSFTDDAGNDETLTSAATGQIAAAATNIPATGAPTIGGYPTTGETLTADTSAIMDDNGLTGVAYTYQWIRVDSSDNETDIAGATSGDYDPVAADVDHRIRLRVSFQDDDGFDESLTSEATLPVRDSNRQATGDPVLSGAERVGETLTLSTSAITDPDGMSDPMWYYNWYRVPQNGGGEENIHASSTVTSYTLVAEDAGHVIRAEAWFRDDYGHRESRHVRTGIIAALDTTAPALDTATVNGATLTLTYDEDLDTGSTPAAGDFTVTVAGSAVSVSNVAVGARTVTLTLASAVAAGDAVSLDYAPGTNPIRDAAENPAAALGGETVMNTTPGVLVAPAALNVPEDSSADYTVVLQGAPSANVTVTPSIASGGDADLTLASSAALTFTPTDWATAQTVTVNAAEDADMDNGTATVTHAVASADAGYDGLSAASVALTEIDNDTALSNDATLSALTLMAGADAVELTPAFAAGTTAYRAWVANSVSAVTVDATANDSNATVGVTGHSSLSAGRNAIEVQVTAEDGLTTGTYTVTLVRAASSPTADPDALLTANVTAGEVNPGTPGSLLGYSFLDGRNRLGAMSDTNFRVGSSSLQVNAVVAVGGSDVSAFEANTLTLCTQPKISESDLATLSAEVGGVSYGFASAMTFRSSVGTCYFWPRGGLSMAWGDVVPVKLIQGAAVNNPATGAPAISGTETVGETLTASTAGIMDDDGLTNVSYSYQWIRVDSSDEEDITGATSATYDLVAADEGATIRVRVSFTDDAGNDETLTSDATGQIAGGADTTPPTLDTAEAHREIVTLTYNEPLDETSVPANGDFEATYKGSPASVTGVRVSGSQVILTLSIIQTAAKPGDVYSLSYTPGSNPIRDLADLSAAALTDRMVTNTLEAGQDPTGAPVISGTERVGETLTVSVAGISDGNGLDNAEFFYTWYHGPSLPSDSDDYLSPASSTLTSYTLLGSDAGRTVRVRVEFEDDQGYAHNLTTAETGAVAPRGTNSPATGAPTISGTADIGFDLNASTAGIADANGLAGVSYAYQWIRVDSSDSETDIAGATGATYTLVAADANNRLKVRVSFRDDDGHPESLTSDAVAGPDTAPPELRSAVLDHRSLTLTFNEALDENVDLALTSLSLVTGSTFVAADSASIDGVAVVVTFANTPGESQYTFRYEPSTAPDSQLRDPEKNEVAGISDFPVTRPANEAATGAPGIGGTEQVGATLTATTADIADANGLEEADYAYQWIRVDTSDNETDISGATSATYELVDADEGATIKVRVSFVDDDLHAETLTSAATGTIAAASTTNNPATGAPTISGVEEFRHVLTASTDGIADADGLTNVSYSYQWIVVSGGTETELATATEMTYLLRSRQVGTGNRVKVRVDFRDDLGNEESLTSAETGAIVDDETAPELVSAVLNGNRLTLTYNEPMLGSQNPAASALSLRDSSDNSIAVTGTNTSGMQITLTLATSAVAGETYVLDYTQPSNTLLRIQDRSSNYVASFTGQAVTNETPGAANNPATGVPSISGVEEFKHVLTASTDGIADADGLTNVSYSYQWIVVGGGTETELATATEMTYLLSKDDVGTGNRMKVRVDFRDDLGNEESLTSAETDVIVEDETPPELLTAVLNGNTLTLTYNEEISRTISPDAAAISLRDSSNDAIAGTGRGRVSGTRVTLTLADSAVAGETYVLDYTPPTSNFERIQDNNQNYAAALTGHAVTNETPGTDTTPPALDTATVNGATLTLTYDEDLDTGSTPAAGDFTVTVAGSAVSVSNVAVGARTVTLTLAAAVAAGDAVSLDYAPGTNPIRDLAENDAAALSGETVTNEISALSDDATLSALALMAGSDAVALTPAFATGTTAYRAWVANSVSAVTVDATANDSNATVGVTGHSSLSAGRNAIEVQVTAEDGSTTETYTVTLVREAGAPTADPDALLTANVTAGEVNEATPGSLLGYNFIGGRNERGAMSNRPFQVGGNNNSMRAVLAVGGAAVSQFQANSLYFCAQSPLPAGDLATLSAEVGGVSYRLASATILDISGGETCYFWPRGGLSMAWGDVVLVKLIQSAAPNNPATGAPAISGTETVGETLTADTSGIMDDDGLTTATYSYQWIRVDSSDDETDITGATSATYELAAADEGATIKVRVSFTDDAGNAETLTSDATGEIAAANNPATGAPTISGTETVGETLTADTSAIMDDDGLTAATYTYQWIRVDTSDNETDITGATSATYDLVDADEDATIKVRVSFTDDAGNEETLTSAATGQIAAADNTPPELVSAVLDYQTLTLTFNEALDESQGLDPSFFQLLVDGNLNEWADSIVVDDMIVVLDFSIATQFRRSDFTFRLRQHPTPEDRLRDLAGNEVAAIDSFTVTRPGNVAATGAPGISGTEQVGAALSASTAGIADANGLEGAEFEYQWIRVDTSDNETDITDATVTPYRLVDADEGATIKVRVSFVDDDLHAETLTSDATGPIAARALNNNPATGAPTISGTTTDGRLLTASTAGIADADGLTSVSYTYQWIRVDTSDNETEITVANDESYRLRTDDVGATIKVRVNFLDDLGNAETLTSAATAVISADTTPPELLSAVVNGNILTLTYSEELSRVFNVFGTSFTLRDSSDNSIAGLRNPFPTFQGVDGISVTLAAEAVGGETYVLDYSPPSEEERRVQDLANNDAVALTGHAVTNETPIPNTPATGAPAISGTEAVGETLTASTAGIADADGLTGVSYSYQWIRVDTSNNETDITGATSETYDLVAADEGATVRVRVSFTDDAGNDETLTSDATGAIGPANNPATGAPTISGVEEFGHVLTASTAGIADADGLSTVSYSYQWIVVGGGTETELATATEMTYELDSGQVGDGNRMKVRVDFQDDLGNNESLISAETGVIVSDTTPPELQSAVLNGTTLTLTYNEPLYAVTDPDASAFSVRDTSNNGIAVSSTNASGMQIVLTLATSAVGGETYVLDYTQPSTTLSRINDRAFNPAAALTGHPVTNNTPDSTAPSLATTGGAVVDGATLTLTYSEALDETSTPAAGDFTVTVDGSPAAVSNVAVSARAVTLTLASEVSAGDAVTLAYTPGANPIRDLAENPAPALSGESVTNNTVPPLTLSMQAAAFDEDAGAVSIPVTLSASWTGTVTVDYSFADGLAGSSDYTGAAGTLSFAPGSTSENIPVTLVDDDFGEADEDFSVVLATPVNAEFDGGGATLEREFTIADDETLSTEIVLSLDVSSLGEDAGATTVTVTGALDEAAFASDITLDVNVGDASDPAEEGVDYATVGVVEIEISAGQTSGSQSFTISPVDDAIDESDETVSIASDGASVSLGGTQVADLTAAGAELTLTDNDTRGVTVSETSLTIAEGGTGIYTVELDSQPTGDVTVTPNLSGDSDVTVSPATLTFTSVNWGDPQAVTVSAAQDADSEDDSASIAHAVSGGDYGSVTAASLDVEVTDDETASTQIALTLNVTSVDEADAATQVTVTGTLDESARATDTQVTVAVGAASDSATEGVDYATVGDLTLTIAAGDTSADLTFPLNPTDDDIDEGDETLSVSGSTTVSGLSVTEASLTIVDNDTRGLDISVATLQVPEGDSATYTVALESQPTANVTVTPSVSGSDDVTVSDALVFTEANWSAPQTVTVSAAEDVDAEEDTATLSHSIAGGDYAGFTVTDTVAVTVPDNDSAATGIVLTVGTASVSEDAGIVTLTVTGTLNGASLPDATDVTLSIGAAGDTAVEGEDYAAVPDFTLTIPSAAVDGTATFTLAVTDDSIDEDNEFLTITGSATDLIVSSTELTIDDNDTRGLVVSESSLTIDEGGTGTYTLTLQSQPTGPVTVTPSVTGSPDVTVTGALTFTALDWNAPQTVTVSAANDEDAEDDLASIAHAVTGADYGAVTADSLAVTVTDDEQASGQVALSLDVESVDEDAGDVTVAVSAALDGTPLSEDTPVTVQIGAAGDTAVEDADYAAVENFELTIPAGSTEASSQFILSVIDDAIDEAEESLTVGGTAGDLAVTGAAIGIVDNDERGLAISETSLEIEEGDSATYTLALTSEPTGDVTVTPSVSGSEDVRVEPPSLTFTAENWSEPQEVVVSAGEDADAQDDEAGIAHNLTGGDYAAVTAEELTVTVTDTDTAADTVRLSLSAESLAEDDGELEVTITAMIEGAVRAEDTEVTVSVGAADDTAVSGEDYAEVADLTLTIPAGDASATASFALSVIDDAIDEENESLTVGATAGDLAVTGATIEIIDNDTRGVSVSVEALEISEGGSASYTLALTSEPAGEVTVTTTLSGDADVSLAPASLTFTPENWSAPQIVTVSAAEDEDAVDDSAVIAHAVSGADYAGETASEVSVTVIDNDEAANSISLAVDRAAVAENAGEATVTVTATLDAGSRSSRTAVTVSVGAAGDTAVSGEDYAAVADFTLTIPSGDASATADFSLSVSDDDIDEADESLTVGGSAGDLAVTGATIEIIDNDTRGVSVSAMALEVDEGGSASYTITLDSQPTGDVTVTPTPGGDTDLTLAPAALTFTAENWSAPQSVTVSAAEDDDELDDSAVIAHAVSGADYDGETVSDLSVTVIDNDEAENSVSLAVDRTSVSEDAGEVTVTVTATLGAGARAEDTEVTVSVGAAGDTATGGEDYATVADFTLTISEGSMSGTATFTLSVTDDGREEGDESLTVGGSADITVSGASISITDNDARGVTTSTNEITLGDDDTASYTVVLDSEPTGAVTITPVVEDNADVTVSPESVTFTAENWWIPQEFKVSLASEAPSRHFRIRHRVSGGGYDDQQVDELESAQAPPEPVALTLSLDPLSLDESAGEAEVAVTATLVGATGGSDIELTLGVGAMGDTAVAGEDYAAVDDLTLTIPAGEESATASFTLGVIDDAIDEEDEALTVHGTTTDTEVTGATLTLTDNDTRGVTLSTTELSVEQGAGASYSLALDSEPTGDVTITPAAAPDSGLTLSPESLVFTAANWNMAQTLTLTAAADAGAGARTISHLVSGGDYDSVAVPDVSVAIKEAPPEPVAVTLSLDPVTLDESAGEAEVAVTATLAGATGGSDIELTLGVGAADDTAVSGGDYAAVDDLTLTIPAGEESATASLTLEVIDDAIDEPDETLSVRGTATDIEVTGATLTLTDNDTRGVSLSASELTLEQGESASYTLVLDSEPTGDVTITPAAASDSGLTLAPEALVFTAANWNMAQTLTLTAAEDAEAGARTISHGISGGDYDSLAVPDVSVAIEEAPPEPVTLTLSLDPDGVGEHDGSVDIAVTASLSGATRDTDIELTLSIGAMGDTAVSGVDYEPVPDLELVVPAGSTSGGGDFAVTIIDDDETEPEEFLTVSGTTDAVSVTIEAADLAILQSDEARAFDLDASAWLSRFGRASADQAIEAIGARMRGERSESQATVGGTRLDTLFAALADGSWPASGDAAAQQDARTTLFASPDHAGALFGESPARPGDLPVHATAGQSPFHGANPGSGQPPFHSDAAGVGIARSGPLGLPNLRDGLLNSNFHLASDDAQDETGGWALWGRASAGRFDGDAEGMGLDGELVGATLGADITRGSWLAGVALSHSRGEGSLGETDIKSTLTSAHPFLRYAAGPTVSLWATAGHGSGEVEVDSHGGSARSDIENSMAALGGRGLLRVSGSFELALVSDLRWTRTEWDGAGDETLRLLGGSGETSRVRVLIEGSNSLTLESGAQLRPRLEAGLRYDGGDAETGAGVEVGAGMDYTSGRLGLELSARGLVAHEDSEYREWGLGASLRYRSLPDGDGLSLNLASSMGVVPSGTRAMWTRETASGLVPGGAADAAARLGLELGYGMRRFEDAPLWTPFLELDSAAGAFESLGMGLRLSSGESLEAGLRLMLMNNLEGRIAQGIEISASYRW